jgi:hypothetical protein
LQPEHQDRRRCTRITDPTLWFLNGFESALDLEKIVVTIHRDQRKEGGEQAASVEQYLRGPGAPELPAARSTTLRMAGDEGKESKDD